MGELRSLSDQHDLADSVQWNQRCVLPFSQSSWAAGPFARLPLDHSRPRARLSPDGKRIAVLSGYPTAVLIWHLDQRLTELGIPKKPLSGWDRQFGFDEYNYVNR
jgi:hypothetical protein